MSSLRSRLCRVALYLAMALALGSGALPAHAQSAGTAGLKTVTMLLPGQVGPGTDVLYYGVDQGIFKRHGIDLQLDAPASVAGASAISLLDSGKYDAGYVSSITMLKARQENGSQLVEFYGLFQSNPTCILVRKSADIRSLDQLKGKMIVFASTTDNTTLLAMLAKHGITPSTATIEYAATAAQFGAFIQGTADAISTYAYSNQPLLRSAHNIDTTAFCQNDDGFNYQWAGYAANASYLAANRDLIRQLVAAIGETYNAAAANPRAAAESMLAHFPNIAPPVDVSSTTIKTQIPYFTTPRTKGLPPGEMSAADWATTKQVAVKYLGIHPDLDVAAAWTNAAYEREKK
jgi:NitT/TauT family transport system substrate-binding protein